MISLDKSFYKFLKYINKKKIVSLDEFIKHYNLDVYEAYEIIKILCKNQYIIAIGDNKYKATYKSKNHLKSSFVAWLINNWLSIIAIIISIIALFKK